MNRISYFQRGGKKELPTAPNAKEAYKGGKYEDGLFRDVIYSKPGVDYTPRTLVQKINPITNDTTYIETPELFDPVNTGIIKVSRKANSSDKDRTEYNLLNRRFNEGASVVNDTITTGPKKMFGFIKPYLQQGGQMQSQDLQTQVIQLVQAAVQGDQQATETVNKIMEAAKAGDQQAMQLAQMILEIAKQMQGQATSAKWGSKLNYIRSLKYANGGKTCPSCEKGAVVLNKPIKKTKVEEKACGGKAKKRYFGGII